MKGHRDITVYDLVSVFPLLFLLVVDNFFVGLVTSVNGSSSVPHIFVNNVPHFVDLKKN